MAIVGIDLGTTNSLVTAFINGKETIIPNTFNELLTPSVVSIDENGELIVGKIAKERLTTHPEQTTNLFKRNMGTKQRVTLSGKDYLPEELSAFVVKQLLADAENYLQEPIEEAVISVPAYFDSKQRAATKKVGDLLGIKVERLINEPSAAAIACHDTDDFETFVVFDFGGGTLDVSVVDCFDNVINVCAIAGDNQLGGSDFDKAIAKSFFEEHGLDESNVTLAKQHSILLNAERVKLELQQSKEASMHVSLNDKEYTSVFTSERLRNCSLQIFEKMKVIIGKAFRDSNFDVDEISSLILVGGSSKMPIVQEYLTNLLNIPVAKTSNTDELVAQGLGKYIGIKQRDESIRDLVVTDVCPFSLATSMYNKNDPSRSFASVIIPKNSTLPCSKSNLYFTTRLGQTEVQIDVNQGEGIYSDENLHLGDTQINVPENYENNEGILVTFSYDINSILFIEVKVTSTGETLSFYLGEDKELVKTNDSQLLKQIKDISLKLSNTPQIDLLKQRVEKISYDLPLNKREAFVDVVKTMNEAFQSSSNNLRKTIILIDHYTQILDQIEQTNSVDNLDIFKGDDDDDDNGSGWLS